MVKNKPEEKVGREEALAFLKGISTPIAEDRDYWLGGHTFKFYSSEGYFTRDFSDIEPAHQLDFSKKRIEEVYDYLKRKKIDLDEFKEQIGEDPDSCGFEDEIDALEPDEIVVILNDLDPDKDYWISGYSEWDTEGDGVFYKSKEDAIKEFVSRISDTFESDDMEEFWDDLDDEELFENYNEVKDLLL